MLTTIFETKKEEVESAKRTHSLDVVKILADLASPPKGFLKTLRSFDGLGLIAEVKKGSPSMGTIRSNFDPAEIAKSYKSAGAQALSVLTDEKYFGGHANNIGICQKVCDLPILRKDFINDPYQVFQSRAWGADAILLIVAALSSTQLKELHSLAIELGMDVLVEVHNEMETEMALEINAPFIGVNNRDLSNFKTDISTSEHLLPKISPFAYAISESGLENYEDLLRVQNAGARTVLIGTAFCASPDIESKVKEVMGR